LIPGTSWPDLAAGIFHCLPCGGIQTTRRLLRRKAYGG
jgi:hypothetical protein